jgi:hypothetical protein
MADKWPLANGLWSNAANWNEGTKPTEQDDVYANGFTVTIDEDIAVTRLLTIQRTGGNNGGFFTISGVRAVVFMELRTNSSNALNVSSGSTVIGSFYGNGANAYAISFTGSFCTLIGNAYGGIANPSQGVRNFSGGTIYFIGDSYGGGGAFCDGINNETSGTVIQTGNAFAGVGSPGSRNNTTGRLEVTTAASNTNLHGLSGNSQSGITLYENLIFDSSGRNPFLGWCKMKVTGSNQITVATQSDTFVFGVDEDAANPSDVRKDVIYNNGNLTGTLAVPPVGAVALGVPVDNTVGTAVIGGITEETLNAALAQVVEAIEAIPTVTPPTTTEISQAVWNKPTTEITTGIGARLKNAATVETTGSQIVGLS